MNKLRQQIIEESDLEPNFPAAYLTCCKNRDKVQSKSN